MKQWSPIQTLFVCSASPLKLRVVAEACKELDWLANAEVKGIDCQPDSNPVQPVNSGRRCA